MKVGSKHEEAYQKTVPVEINSYDKAQEGFSYKTVRLLSMSQSVGSDDSQPEQSTQQNVEGDRNQIVAKAFGSTFISQQTVQNYSIPNQPSQIEEIKAKQLNLRSPYLGLRKFEVRDKDLYFGRANLVQRLLDKLGEAPFLLVLGASGSGKSSLIRAGLIPQLREKLGAGFRDLILTPDRDPFYSLAASLRTAGFRQSELEPLQSGQPEALSQVVQSLKPQDEDWLIFIDQFEELFTLCQDLQKRQAFVSGLVKLRDEPQPGVQLVLAMRADFLDRFTAYPQLRGILNYSDLITDMTSAELQDAIEQPAAQHGVVLEPALTEQIIRDLKGRRGTATETERTPLPLLQYTLKLLWESSGDLGDRTLRISTYQQLQGVRGALQRHVDEIYKQLSKEQQQTVKHIFLQLVDTTTADAGTTAVGKAVSRRAKLSEFGLADQEVLTRLVNEGLLMSDDPTVRGSQFAGDADHSPTVELSHETLIDAWDTLKVWIEESRPLIRLKNQLKDDAYGWFQIYQQNPVEAEKELWQGSKLQHLLSQKQEILARFGDFKDEEAQFIEACEELGDRQQRQALEHEQKLRAAAEARAKSEKQRAQMAIASGIVLAALSGLSILFAIQADQARRDAQAKEVKALVATAEAISQAGDQLRALIASVEALKQLKINRMQLPDSLQKIITQTHELNRLEGHENQVFALAINPQQGLIASGGGDETIKIWNTQGKLLKDLRNPDGVVSALAFSANGEILASGSIGETIRLWTNKGEFIKAVNPKPLRENIAVNRILFSPDQETIAVANYEGNVGIWNIQSGKREHFLKHSGNVTGISFNKTGSLLASASNDGTVWLWKLPEGEVIEKFNHGDDVNDVSFNPDEKLVASAGEDGIVKIWRIKNKELLQKIITDSEVFDIDFNSDGSLIASANNDKSIKVWRAADGKLEKEVRGHSNAIYGVQFISNSDNSSLISASADQTVRIWKLDELQTDFSNTEVALKDVCLRIKDFLTTNVKLSNQERRICTISR